MKVITTSSLSDSTVRPDHEAFRQPDGRIYAGWKAVLGSLIGVSMGPAVMLVFCFGTFAPALERQFRWGIGPISFGATLISLVLIVDAPLAGYLADRLGARRLILWSMPLLASGMVAMSFLRPDIRIFYVMLVLVTLGTMGGFGVAYNKVASGWFDRHLGLSLGIANLGLGIGAALIPAVAGYLIAAEGWRWTYRVLGMIALAPWPFAFLLIKDHKRSAVILQDQRGAADAGGLAFRDAIRTREFALILTAFFIVGAMTSTMVVHQTRILLDIGLSRQSAAGLQAALGIALTTGRAGTGWLLDHFKAKVVMSILCISAALALGLFAAGAPWGSAVIAPVMIGFVIGAEYDVLGFFIPRYFGRRAFGALYGLIYSAFQLASALGIAVFGIARGALGSYTLPLYALAAFLLIGALLFTRLGPYRYSADT